MLCGQSFLRWHLQVFIDTPHSLYEQTLFRFARHDGRPGLSALEQPFSRVEHETAFDLVGLMTVALVAVLGEDGLDLLLVKLDYLAREVGIARLSANNETRGP